MRFVSIIYDRLSKNDLWFNVMVLQDKNFIDITLDNSIAEIKFKICNILKDKIIDRYKYDILEIDKLVFDYLLLLVVFRFVFQKNYC